MFSLLIAFLASSLVICIPQVTIDYTAYHNKVKEIANLPLPESQVLTEYSTHMDCAFPPRSIMFTYTTHYTVDFMKVQHKAMETSGLRACLEARFITICLDDECMNFCSKENILNCVLIDLGHLPPSDFNQGEYHFLTYLKHDLLYESLKFAERVFFFDADCLLFKNPWIEIQFGRDEEGKYILGDYDLMFQRDRGRGPSCVGSANSGQIYLRNSSSVQVYLQTMQSHKEVILEGKNGLDQDYVEKAAVEAGLKKCSLTPALYTAHCYLIFGNIQYINHGLPVHKIITYHTSCSSGVGNKLKLLHKVLDAVHANSSHPIGGVLRH